MAYLPVIGICGCHFSSVEIEKSCSTNLQQAMFDWLDEVRELRSPRTESLGSSPSGHSSSRALFTSSVRERDSNRVLQDARWPIQNMRECAMHESRSAGSCHSICNSIVEQDSRKLWIINPDFKSIFALASQTLQVLLSPLVRPAALHCRSSGIYGACGICSSALCNNPRSE